MSTSSFHPHPWIHSMQQSTNQSTDQSINQSNKSSQVQQRLSVSINQSFNQPTNQLTNSSLKQSLSQSVTHFFNRSINQWTQRVARPTQPNIRSTQSTNQSTTRSIHPNQSLNQPINQSTNQSRNYFAHMDDYDDGGLPYTSAMIAGASAGVMEHLFMFPVDTIKTRMQAANQSINQSMNYRTFASSLSTVVREEGALRLYRGVNAAVMGAIPSHAANYAVYEYFKHRFGGNDPGHHVFANAAAGALATASHDAVITPLDVVKQRLQVVASPYSGVLDCIRTVARQEGFVAFYASYPTTVLMNVPFMAVHFAGYESFKLLLTGLDRAADHTIGEELLAGAGAGACAGLVSTPLDVVKTRIQTQNIPSGATRMGAIDVAKAIWKEAGAKGFTRGASARVLYFMPSSAICWTTYETVKRLLKDAHTH